MMKRAVYVDYLGHSGFALDTGATLMVFDYWDTGKKLLEAAVKDTDSRLFFFSSHDHHDHYDRAVERYKARNAYKGHFAGWERPGGDLIYVKPHKWMEHCGIKVYALESNDSGAAFLVSADGINVFHGGDLAGWEDETWESFSREIDDIRGTRIDIAFLAVTTFSGEIQESMRKAAGYFLEMLEPAVFMPMHANSREYLYKEFKAGWHKDDPRVVCPEFPGQKFRFEFV